MILIGQSGGTSRHEATGRVCTTPLRMLDAFASSHLVTHQAQALEVRQRLPVHHDGVPRGAEDQRPHVQGQPPHLHS